jgi:hypothetical protein
MNVSSSMLGSIFQTSPASKAKGASGSDMDWANGAPSTGGASAARTEFANYQKMTPAEKMHAAMLAQLGITKEQYDAMSDDDRAKIDEKIKEMIKQQVENSAGGEAKTGIFADMKV